MTLLFLINMCIKLANFLLVEFGYNRTPPVASNLAAWTSGVSICFAILSVPVQMYLDKRAKQIAGANQ